MIRKLALPINRLPTFFCLTLAFTFLAGGCTTAWKEEVAFYRPAQTHLSVTSTPPGKLYVNNRFIGVTPVSAYLDCEEEVKRRIRNVSYWHTEPGYSTLITVLSLGSYLPFSAIPADSETSMEPSGAYKDTAFQLRVDADGYTPWEEAVRCGGQKEVSFATFLAPVGTSPVPAK